MNPEVLQALAKAKWNESVTVEIAGSNDESGSDTPRSMILVPKLDRENGGVKWEQEELEEPTTTTTTNTPSTAINAAHRHHIHTKKWIFPMLHDRRRNNLYEKAIERASREAVRRFLKSVPQTRKRQKLEASSSSVSSPTTTTLKSLDIGSGTGLLAMLSEKYLSRALVEQTSGTDTTTTTTTTTTTSSTPICNVEVTSVEMAGPMADLAKRTVDLRKKPTTTSTENRDGGDTPLPSSTSIRVIEGHSCQILPMREKEDGACWLCTSELLESGLLREGWLPAMRDAWNRHLRSNSADSNANANANATLNAAVVLPQGARVMAQLVEGCSGFCGPHQSLELENGGHAGKPPLRLFTTTTDDGMLSDGSVDPFTGRKHGVLVEIHADRYLKTGSLRVLSDPIEGLSLDVTSPTYLPSAESSTRLPVRTSFAATETGKAEGILFWWELDLYDDLKYSTGPGTEFQDHWHQCLYVFPTPFSTGESIDDDQRHIQKGSEHTLLTSHTDSRVHFALEDSTNDTAAAVTREGSKPTIIPERVPPVAGPRRCLQLNDLERSAKFRDGIRYALERLRARTTNTNNTMMKYVLDLSDFSLCGMMASILGGPTCMVTSVESSSGGLPLAAAKVSFLGNGFGASSSSNNNNNGNDNFQIVNCHAESLTREIVTGKSESLQKDADDDTPQPKDTSGVGGGDAAAPADPVVDLVVGEPYYEMLEGWPIETALNYFYSIRRLRKKGIIRPDAICVPELARVLACGIECEDLRGAYRKQLGSRSEKDTNTTTTTTMNDAPPVLANSVCGFDHTPITECWNYDQKGISIPLWEYNGVTPVTETVEVGVIDCAKNAITCGGSSSLINHFAEHVVLAPFLTSHRTCHAVVFWVDYHIRSSPSRVEILSTGCFGTAFPASSPSQQQQSARAFSSICAEHQTVRILAEEQRTVLGESLPIPRYGLEF